MPEASPLEWLLDLEQRFGAYEALLKKTGSLAIAAHRLAVARCFVRDAGIVPTEVEVHVAAKEIHHRAQLINPVPTRGALASECRSAGLLVL